MADGTCRPFDGDVDAYMAWSLTAAAKPKAEARAGRARLRGQIRDAEAGLEAIGAEKAEMERRLADPAVYDGPPDALRELLKRQGEIARRLAEAAAEWLAAQEALEAARL